jgi:hypothetical protein
MTLISHTDDRPRRDNGVSVDESTGGEHGPLRWSSESRIRMTTPAGTSWRDAARRYSGRPAPSAPPRGTSAASTTRSATPPDVLDARWTWA